MLERLATTISSRSFFRAAVTAVCVITFLFVGFAHGVQHVNTPVSAVVLTVGADSVDDVPDPSSKVAIAIEYCSWCAMHAIEVAAPALAFAPVPLVINSQKADSVRAHPPHAETPPPIFVI